MGKNISTELYTIYDLETLCNLITGCFMNYTTKQRKQFIIHESRNDINELCDFLFALKENKWSLVGFNNVSFDGQIIQFILDNHKLLRTLKGDECAQSLYAKAQQVITTPENERFANSTPEWKFHIPQIDLYKQKHYDGKAKRTSLKWLEYTMRLPNIEEMPIPHDVPVTKDQIENILSYNWNDVEATHEFFHRNKFETELRLNLSKQFDISLLNASEPRMAREILAKVLAEDMSISTKELKEKRTFRKEIHLGKCIIPVVRFNTDCFNELVSKLNRTTINANKTKGCFEHSIVHKGINIEYGVGGVHGAVSKGIYSSNDEYIIKTVDVTSFYPNMIINYGFVPAHLGKTFASRYKWFFTERQKISKKDPINYIYKIILNSAYGLTNDMNSFLYDPLVTMKTTINGQLLLSMLAESLSEIPNSKLLMMNTDGLEIRILRKDEDFFNNLCTEWEEATSLKLEHDQYDKMIIGDVNNYIGVFTERKAKSKEDWLSMQKSEPNYLYREDEEKYFYSPVKLKGRYELKLEYHKNPSGFIITKAVYNHLVKGIPVEETMANGDIYDFCYGVKKKYNFDLILHSVKDREHIQHKQQKVTRFFMSTDGGKLVKKYDDGRVISVGASALVTPINRVNNHEVPLNLNKNFYIKEAWKEIKNLEQPESNQLMLF